ncbi:hypothetical protein MRX96_043678 [Rhipicephalus microplus]
MSQSKLAKICPLKQSLLSTIVNNKFTGKLGAEKCKEFGTWFMQYRQSSPGEWVMPRRDVQWPPATVRHCRWRPFSCQGFTYGCSLRECIFAPVMSQLYG